MLNAKRLILILFVMILSSQLKAQQKSLGYYENAQSFLNSGQNNQAILEINKLLREESDNTDALFLRAYIYLVSNQPDKSLADYDRILEIVPQHEAGLVNRSLIHMENKRYELALADLKKLTQLRPKDPSSWFDLAYCYGLMGNNTKAILNFDKSIAIDQTNASSYANRGFCKINLATNSGFTEADTKRTKDACDDLFQAQTMGDTTVKRMIKQYCN